MLLEALAEKLWKRILSMHDREGAAGPKCRFHSVCQRALQNISGNIANSQTVGYKETDTAFDALVSQAALGEQTSGGVFATSVASNGVQGTIQNETVATDMAINGQGYFVVTKSTGNSGTTPQFSGVNDYTRRGDFQMDSNGFLVNGAGYYLMGIPVSTMLMVGWAMAAVVGAVAGTLGEIALGQRLQPPGDALDEPALVLGDGVLVEELAITGAVTLSIASLSGLGRFVSAPLTFL